MAGGVEGWHATAAEPSAPDTDLGQTNPASQFPSRTPTGFRPSAPGAQPRRGCGDPPPLSQGGRGAPTLGFGPQSLWDCQAWWASPTVSVFMISSQLKSSQNVRMGKPQPPGFGRRAAVIKGNGLGGRSGSLPSFSTLPPGRRAFPWRRHSVPSATAGRPS